MAKNIICTHFIRYKADSILRVGAANVEVMTLLWICSVLATWDNLGLLTLVSKRTLLGTDHVFISSTISTCGTSASLGENEEPVVGTAGNTTKCRRTWSLLHSGRGGRESTCTMCQVLISVPDGGTAGRGSDSEIILKVGPGGLADVLNMEYERKESRAATG